MSTPSFDLRPSELTAAAEQVRRDESLQHARRFAEIRLVGVTAFLALFVIIGRGFGHPAWIGGDAVLACYAAGSLALLLGVRRSVRVARWSGATLALFDIPMIAAVQLTLLPHSPYPAEVMRFNVATLIVVVGASVLFLRPSVVVLTAALGAVVQSGLQLMAGVEPTNLLSTIVLFGIAAAVGVSAANRLAARILEAATRLIAERHAEEQLHAVRAAFRHLIDLLPDGVLIHRHGRVIYANEALARLLDREPAVQLTGLPVSELTESNEAALAGAESAAGPREVQLRRGGGGVVPVEALTVAASFDDQPAVLTVVRDLTARKAAEQQTLLSERMLSMGMLAAGVAHEINNPLTVVLGVLEMLGERAADRDDRRTAHEAVEAATRIRDIVRDLKLFTRGGEAKRGPVDVEKVVASTVRLAWNEIRHRATLVTEYGPVPRVEANEARLGQVILNLVINAAQAIPAGDAEHHGISLRTATRSDGWAVIEVRDTGSGIPSAVLPRIFDPFFTTKPVGVGTGLGLAICHRIISELGGVIQVETSDGRGSTFRVLLPPARVEAASRAAPAAAGPSGRARVLVVDDEPLVARTAERLLKGAHDVTVVSDAETALARVRDEGPFDVILCDLMMPQTTGMDLHGWLTAFAPELADRMIFMTGGAFTPEAGAFLDRVPNARIEKPFDAVKLRALVAARAPTALAPAVEAARNR